MSLAAENPEPKTVPNTPLEDMLLLDELIGIGADYIRDMRDMPQLLGQDRVRDYDILMRSIRRSILLKQRLAAEPAPAQPAKRAAARQQVIRKVQDAIHERAEGADADRLRAELVERLEDPEFDDELDTRPTNEVIDDIIHDMHLIGPYDANRFARRTPQDIARLRAIAARSRPPHHNENAPTAPPPHSESPAAIRRHEALTRDRL